MAIYRGFVLPAPQLAHKKDSMIVEAIEFAAQAHAGQYRKVTRFPYIIHPLQVAGILVECDCYRDMIIAAILHDTVEDTAVSLDEIRERFGETVSGLVKDVSEPDKTLPWEDRKGHTLSFLKTAPMDVLLLSCADKLDNIRSIRKDASCVGEEKMWTQFKRGKEQQAWYYHSLAAIFMEQADGNPGALLFESFRREVDAFFRNG